MPGNTVRNGGFSVSTRAIESDGASAGSSLSTFLFSLR
jgi:hypothetical protein